MASYSLSFQIKLHLFQSLRSQVMQYFPISFLSFVRLRVSKNCYRSFFNEFPYLKFRISSIELLRFSAVSLNSSSGRYLFDDYSLIVYNTQVLILASNCVQQKTMYNTVHYRTLFYNFILSRARTILTNLI